MRLDQLDPLQHVMDASIIGLIDDVDTSGDIVYIGMPLNNDPSVKTSQAKWRIMKISKNGFITTKALAGGTEEFNQVWDNRATTCTYTTFA